VNAVKLAEDDAVVFTIQADRVLEILEEQGMPTVLEGIREAAMIASRSYQLNELGALEAGSSIQVSAIAGLSVLIDGNRVARQPGT